MHYGRDTQRERVEHLLAGARDGVGGALVVRGEAGIGKTTLLDAAVAGAGMPVLRAVGVESESKLPFAALHLLLRPTLHLLEQLPAGQAAALRCAFGLERGVVGDGFLVGVAALTLLSEYAGGDSLLVVLDDVQWLDESSAAALLFVARRLDTEGIAMLLGLRDGERIPDVRDLPQLALTGLPADAAARLLSDRHPDLSPHVREQLLQVAGGNPLALLELAGALTPEQRAGHLLPQWLTDGSVAIPRRVETVFIERLRALPQRTRVVLQLTATDCSGTLDVILRATAASGATAADLDPAERARLVRIVGGEVTFTHPLVRAAILADATFSERVSRNAALAAALADAPAGSEGRARRAWHLAAAATGCDDAVASELAAVAAEVSGRQGTVTASAAYERAAQLTTSPSDRARWLVAAAREATRAAQMERAATLADRAADIAAEPAVLAGIAEVRGRVVALGRGMAASVEILMNGAGHVRQADPAWAAYMLAQALRAALLAGDPRLMEDAAAALAAVPEPDDPRARRLVRSLRTYGRMVLGDPDARPEPGDCPDELFLAAVFSTLTDEAEVTQRLAETCLRRCRETGATGWIPATLTILARAQLTLGRVAGAELTATEALHIAEDTNFQLRACVVRALLAEIAAVTGDEKRVRTLAAAAIEKGEPWHLGVAVGNAELALGLLELGMGDPGAALRHFERATRRFGHPRLAGWLAPYRIEAAARAGRLHRAGEELRAFEMSAQRLPQPSVQAMLCRCRALLAPDDEAEAHYRAALAAHERTQRPFEQARTQLAYGEWLRRNRRRRDARQYLRAALVTFEGLRAAPWSARARVELQATGERVDPAAGAADPLAALSHQERQVVRLAATGASNREIAARLFLSPRTVGHHLYKAYPKLGVTSRTELPTLVGR